MVDYIIRILLNGGNVRNEKIMEERRLIKLFLPIPLGIVHKQLAHLKDNGGPIYRYIGKICLVTK